MERGQRIFVFVLLAIVLIGVVVAVGSITGNPILKLFGGKSSSLPGQSSCKVTTEICDNKDNDCDKQIDENGVCGVVNTSLDGLCEEIYLHGPTNSSRLYIGDSINKVRQYLTKADLPNLLADGNFVGNVDAEYQQDIYVGNNTIMAGPPVFVQLNDHSDTADIFYVYRLNIDSIVNFTSPDSVGEILNILGHNYRIGPDTTSSSLFLYGSSVLVDLSIGGNSSNSSSKSVIVGGKTYTIELISATDNSATIKLTNSAGNSETKEVNEYSSKTILGLQVALNSADETPTSMTTKLTIGVNQLKLIHNQPVSINGYPIDGTYMLVNSPLISWGNNFGFSVHIFAPDTDNDQIFVGNMWNDLVFNNFKFVFESYQPAPGNGARLKFGGCICGDVDGSGMGPDITDLVVLVAYMFQGGSAPVSMWAANVNGQGGIDISDLIYMVHFMFQNGPDPYCVSPGVVQGDPLQGYTYDEFRAEYLAPNGL